MSKAFSTALSLGLASFVVANLGLSAYAVTGDVKLRVNVKSAIALTIQSSSDGSTIYAESDPAGQVVNNYTGTGYTAFGTSSAKTNMLPNTADESMWSKVTVYTNNIAGYKLTVSDTDENTSLTTGTYTIPTSTTIAAGTSAWAFKGGKFADYTAMSPVSSALTIAESTTASALDGDMTKIHYGISTSADQATGTYSDTIVYTVTGEEASPTLDSVAMQDFTCPLLKNIGDTSTITDSRDGKTYSIAKLADGNCWMTQNLALELDSSKTLTPDDTDITENWTPMFDTIAPDDIASWEHYNVEPQSYYSGSSKYGSYYNLTAALGRNEIPDYDWAMSIDKYETSVCPKGWRLPTADEYYNLSLAYGLSLEVNTDDHIILESNPLNFVRGGYAYGTHNSGEGKLKEKDEVAYYMQSDRYSPYFSMTFYYNSEYVMTSDFWDGSYGYNIRCVARY